jgi:hypothetical protein
MKPRGFWYGFGNEWIDWVRGEMPEWEGEYLYEVDIGRSNILQIKTTSEITIFNKKYQASESKHGYSRVPGYAIDWGAVAKKYDGIEINPYQWGCRLKYIWYYSWDVAGGCVWNLAHIQLKQIEPKI